MAQDFCAAHGIVVQNGDDQVTPVQRFEDSCFSSQLQARLRERSYSHPTPIQAICWPVASSGRDLIAISVTGSGKTLAYMLPALFHISTSALNVGAVEASPCALVLAPTRELAQQIHSEAVRYSGAELWWNNGAARSVCCMGGGEIEPQKDALKAGVELVVATPGRLLYFAARGVVDLAQISFFVLDEADRMLDMGFAPQVAA